MKKQYWINVKNVDNRLVIHLDGETIWDSGIVHDDPAINKMIEITGLLGSEPNCCHELIFEGFNNDYVEHEDLSPWHFNYRVFCRTVDESGRLVAEEDLLKPFDEKHRCNPQTRAIANSYRFLKTNGEFKVVRNTLSQECFD